MLSRAAIKGEQETRAIKPEKHVPNISFASNVNPFSHIFLPEKNVLPYESNSMGVLAHLRAVLVLHTS